MKKTALVIMAAGIGSRFGKGIKQLEPVGPNGELIMDYSIHDALKAGFDKIVFIIRKDLEQEFKERIGNRVEKIAPVEYVYQELDALPEGFALPEGRKKPWGTGQAVWACRNVVKEPFAVINADDYYGKEAFEKLHGYLAGLKEDQPFDFCMAGFLLANTLSDSGPVTRGVCRAEDGKLLGVSETYQVKRGEDGKIHGADKEGSPVELALDSRVSMNMWGLTPEIFGELEKGFAGFLSRLKKEDVKSEYLLPEVIDGMIQTGAARVQVLETCGQWFGMTYQEDCQAVREAFGRLIAAGVYPKQLYS